MKAQLIVTAAGLGERLGYSIPKALVPISGTPLLIHTLRKFRSIEFHADIIVTAPPGFEPGFLKTISKHHAAAGFQVIAGGETRQASVANGLAALDDGTEVVAIHDAARPFIDAAVVRRTMDFALEYGGATVALRCADTILEADSEEFLSGTPDRARLWACQTPQTFRVDVIRSAYAAAMQRGRIGTDDATLVRENGGRVKLVSGTPANFKITTREDLAYAEFILGPRASSEGSGR